MYWIGYIFTTGLEWVLEASRAIWSLLSPLARAIRFRLGANGVESVYQSLVLGFVAAVIVGVLFTYIPPYLRVVLAILLVILALPFFLDTPAFRV